MLTLAQCSGVGPKLLDGILAKLFADDVNVCFNISKLEDAVGLFIAM